MPSTVHIDSYRGWSGGQEQSLGLALALAARGEEVRFIAQSGSALAERLKGTYLNWEAIALRGAAGVGAAFGLTRRFLAAEPEIVHVHDSAAVASGALGARMAGGIPVVVTRRTQRPLRGGWLGRVKYGWCERVICVSEAVKRQHFEVGLPEELLTVIPDFVDCRHFDPGSAGPRDPAGPPTMLIMGQLSADKGHRVLLDAMHDVIGRAPEARLRIAGRGEEEPRLRAQAGALGLAGRVEFTGFLNDVRGALAQADVFVQPSLWEGLGLAVLEAMAMGKPVVVSDAGGLPESVVEGETGLVVRAGDAGALGEAILFLIRNPDRAREMGEAGRRRAVEVYDRPRIVERILALYEEVLSERE
jgi:glycosyltransferase involved in cell wall biosynthesis